MKRIHACLAALGAASLLLTACTGGGGGTPPVLPTPTTNPGGGNGSVTCPQTGPAAASVASTGSSQSINRGAPVDNGTNSLVPGLINVMYTAGGNETQLDNAAAREGARAATTARFEALGLRIRTYAVDPSKAASLISQLRASSGVVHVEQAQYRHLTATVSPNDPYYRGFGPGAPYYESASVPGQWDMHVINVGTAWGYYTSLPAVGAAIAIIDTGVDVTHPEMGGGRVVRQACYVTYPSNTAQSTGSHAVDTDGHGTNVAGIADADTNNGFGFAGVAYGAHLLAYRIFPSTPATGCVGSSNPQCNTTDVDEVAAINDAVANNAKVINLSLGATQPCQDSIEETAIEAAILHGVVVVAAAGNESKNGLDCPASYPGVIAVGAEGPGGSSDTEQVAGYSNYLIGTDTGSGGAFLVAPGGDASGSGDSNDLHFIENITSSEMSGAATFCATDFAGASGDCRAGFAGTSQATPHVAGTVSLMLGLRPNLTPRQIAADLCSTSDSIGDLKQGCGRLNAAAAVAKALTQ